MSLGFLIVEDHPLYGEALQSVLASAMADARIEFARISSRPKLSLQRRDRFDLVSSTWRCRTRAGWMA